MQPRFVHFGESKIVVSDRSPPLQHEPSARALLVDEVPMEDLAGRSPLPRPQSSTRFQAILCR